MLATQKQETEALTAKATELQTKATNVKKRQKRHDEALENKSAELVKLKGDVSSNLHQLQKTAGKLAKAKKIQRAAPFKS